MTKQEAIRILEQSCPKRPQKLWSIKRKEAVKMAIEALQRGLENVNADSCSEKPNRSDTIYRQDAIDAIVAWTVEDRPDVEMPTDLIDRITGLPSAQPVRLKGRWIERNPQNSDKCRLIECDQCGFSHIVGFNVPYEHWIKNRNFCERCGADMRGENR